MGDACSRCGGHGKVPKVKGDYREWVICSLCKGSGGRRPANQP